MWVLNPAFVLTDDEFAAVARGILIEFTKRKEEEKLSFVQLRNFEDRHHYWIQWESNEVELRALALCIESHECPEWMTNTHLELEDCVSWNQAVTLERYASDEVSQRTMLIGRFDLPRTSTNAFDFHALDSFRLFRVCFFHMILLVFSIREFLSKR
jgi:hypothetical protein